jgi:hypothetical protein
VEIASGVALFGFLDRWNDPMGTTPEGIGNVRRGTRFAIFLDCFALQGIYSYRAL